MQGRWLAAGLVALFPVAALADDWRVLDGPGIRAALEARVLGYGDGTVQDFLPDGRSLAGDQWGKWSVQGNRYCSVWPPSDRWVCYDVALRGTEVRFTSDSGAQTLGVYVDVQ